MKITEQGTTNIRTYFVLRDGVEFDVHAVTYHGAPYEPLVFVRGPAGWQAFSPDGEYQGDDEGAVRDAVNLYLGAARADSAPPEV